MGYPLVSIIIPTYNYASFISATLDSLVKQSYGNWEAIVVDDGSEDETEAVVKHLAASDPRIKYFFQNNAGLSAARNTGLKKANGDFIHFLDADDLISEFKIERQVHHLLAHTEVDLSYTDAYYFRSGELNVLYKDISLTDVEWMPKLQARGEPLIQSFIQGNIMPVNSVLIRKEVVTAVGYFDENLKSLEDWDYWARCAFKGYYFSFLNDQDSFALIRTHGQSMSNNRIRMLEAEVQMRAHFRTQILTMNTGVEQRKMLLKKASIAEKRLYIEMISLLGLGNFKQLNPLFRALGWRKFIKYYVKTAIKVWKLKN